MHTSKISTDTQRRQCRNQVSPLSPSATRHFAETARLIIPQKIRSTSDTSFSAFGISTIFILGSIITIVSYSIEPLVAWTQKRRNLDVYARLEWTTNETLQLQRLAHEEIGLGEWRGACEGVPYTVREEHFGILDLENIKHPKLRAPPKSFEEQMGAGDGGGGARSSSAQGDGVDRASNVENVGGDASVVRTLDVRETRSSLGSGVE